MPIQISTASTKQELVFGQNREVVMEDKRMIKHELAERLYEKCFLGFLDAFYPDEYLALISEYQQAVLLYEEIILQDGKAETEWVKL